jgi:hypothetical protein
LAKDCKIYTRMRMSEKIDDFAYEFIGRNREEKPGGDE